jgi:ornithine cyclodeaminase/alanine dehydrogenase-like protein (mu-crystallin family)
MRYLDEVSARAVLRWDPRGASMEPALAAFSSGRVLQPVRNMLTIEEDKRYLGIMPAVADEAMGVKLVSFYPGNAGTRVSHAPRGDPSVPSRYGRAARRHGRRAITEMRTAAVSAAVTNHLASSQTHVLALLGSGVQASAQWRHCRASAGLTRCGCGAKHPTTPSGFAEKHGARAAPSAESAVRDADVIVTATNAREPILRGAWLKPAAHVNAVSSTTT